MSVINDNELQEGFHCVCDLRTDELQEGFHCVCD